MALHFVGVAPDQMPAAIRLWGEPDFVHPRALWSVMGEIPGTDTVIIGRTAYPFPLKWRGKRSKGGFVPHASDE